MTDASGNGHTGTLANATWAAAASTARRCSSTAPTRSSRSRRRRPAPLDRDDLEAWVNPSTINNAWRDVIDKGNDNYYLRAPRATRRGRRRRDRRRQLRRGLRHRPLPTNTWSFLTATYDGSNVRLYLNGTQVASTAHTGLIASSSNPLTIGSDNIYGQYFAGLIDNVRIYNVALTATQIQTDQTTPVSSTAGHDTRRRSRGR